MPLLVSWPASVARRRRSEACRFWIWGRDHVLSFGVASALLLFFCNLLFLAVVARGGAAEGRI
jgi:hypothetical protein